MFLLVENCYLKVIVSLFEFTSHCVQVKVFFSCIIKDLHAKYIHLPEQIYTQLRTISTVPLCYSLLQRELLTDVLV